MMDFNAFTSEERNFLIAPAGYGKTYIISASIKNLEPNGGRSLILTHTHAGVASLKSKIREMGISGSQYNIETISSFCQKYTKAFYRGHDIPDASDRGRHDFAVENACKILKLPAICEIVRATYKRVFVDEYQDCSAKQHEFILLLSNWISTHILGDPLQGIFGEINREKGSVRLPEDLIENGFIPVPELNTPYRWQNNGNNKQLGEAFVEIRKVLLSGKPLNLSEWSRIIEVVKVADTDSFNPRANCWQIIWKLIRENSVLVIEPRGIRVSERVKFAQKFKHQFTVLEAIDDPDFYNLSKSIDQISGQFNYSILREQILFKLFGKTVINEWFGDSKVKKKQGDKEKASSVLKQCVEALELSCSSENMFKFLVGLKNGLMLIPPRNELFTSIVKSLETAMVENSTVFDAMRKHRDNIRRSGRKCSGRFIGTTLLTKGLEFDTVVILDAHLIECPKHLYVAMTRACKRLIVFTKNDILLG